MSTPIEDIIGEGFSNVIGDPTIIGLVFLGFFVGFVFLQDTRMDLKVAIIIPVCLLAMVWLPWFGILIALAVGALAYLALMKFINR